MTKAGQQCSRSSEREYQSASFSRFSFGGSIARVSRPELWKDLADRTACQYSGLFTRSPDQLSESSWSSIAKCVGSCATTLRECFDVKASRQSRPYGSRQ